MKRFSLLLVLIVGCAPMGGGNHDPAPIPPVPSASLAGACEKSASDYPARLADVCDDIARRLDAGEFEAQSQVFDAFHNASADARHEAMATWEKAFNEAVPPNQALTVDKTSAAFREAAIGFRNGAGFRKGAGK